MLAPERNACGKSEAINLHVIHVAESMYNNTVHGGVCVQGSKQRHAIQMCVGGCGWVGGRRGGNPV